MKNKRMKQKYERRILVTGGAGFIASALAERLSEDTSNLVVVLDNLSTGDIRKLPPAKSNLYFVEGDVNDYRTVLEVMMTYAVDYVFHYAAVVGVNRTQMHPIRVLEDLRGIENVCKISKERGVKRVFYASSSEVYGDPVEFPQNAHNTPLNSRVPYAVVKNAGEVFLRSYHKEYGLDYTIFRFFNTYGPKQSKDFVISKFINMALRGDDISIYGDGSQSRTFCYIDDNIEATVKIAYNDLFINDVVNIGNSRETSVLELANIIIGITGSKSKIVYLPPLPEGDMKRRCPDNSDMLKVLGRPLVKLEDGIRNILGKGLFELTKAD